MTWDADRVHTVGEPPTDDEIHEFQRDAVDLLPKSWLDPATWDACKTRVGYSVSYRQRWFSRRLFACGFVAASEAVKTADWMAASGYRRVRIDVDLLP